MLQGRLTGALIFINQGAAGLLFDPEKEKKIKKIKEKLSSIQSLKSLQDEGKPLEKNQVFNSNSQGVYFAGGGEGLGKKLKI